MNNTDYSRSDRVAVMMQRELAAIIRQEVKDPRLSTWVTLLDITVSSDLKYAKVYFTVLKDDPRLAEEILNSAAHYLRKILAKSLKLRFIPELHFVYDDSLAYGNRLSRLIDKANPEQHDEKTV